MPRDDLLRVVSCAGRDGAWRFRLDPVPKPHGEHRVKRLLVVVELSAAPNPFHEKLRRAGLEAGTEVFVLFPRFAPMPPARFWREAHTRLDALLQELSDFGVIADGIVTEASCADAVAGLVGSFAPSKVVMVTRRRGSWYRSRLEDALRARASALSPPSISWSSI
jgi:hypothetical protein